MITFNPASSLLRFHGLGVVLSCLWLLLKPCFVDAQSNNVVCPTDTFRFPEIVITANDKKPINYNVNRAPDKEGYYKVLTTVNFNSGNEQINESFFLLVRQGNMISYPEDPNIDTLSVRYKVIEDDSSTVPGQAVERDAGIFYFREGANVIELHHYAEIAQQFPQFINCNPDLKPGKNDKNCGIDSLGRRRVTGFQSIHINVYTLVFVNRDLQLTHTAVTDTNIVLAGDIVQAVATGQTYSYRLIVKNNRTIAARNFTLSDTIPALLEPEFLQRKPDSRMQVVQDSIFAWRFDSLGAFADSAIIFNVRVPPTLAPTPFRLFSRSEIIAICDSLPSNNFDSTEVYAIVPPKLLRYNLSHAHTASRDTVLAGEKYSYTLVVTNLGPETARNFTLSDTIPTLLIPEFLQRQPNARTQVLQDSVFVWQFDSLSAGAEDSIVFEVRVPASIPFTPYRLFSRSQVVTVGDTLPQDNFASATVYAIAPTPPSQYNLSHRHLASRDTVLAGEEYSYTLFVTNLGQSTARNFSLSDTIPALLTPEFLQRRPEVRMQVSQDSVFVWQFDSLAAGAKDSIVFNVMAPVSFPFIPYRLFSRSEVVAVGDTMPQDNFASATVYAIAPTPPGKYNLSHRHFASRDTVLAGKEYSYTLTVTNLGPATARTFTLSDTIPALLAPEFLQRQPNARTQVLQDSVFVWQFDSLAMGARDSIVFNVMAPASFPFTPYRLFSRSEVVAVGDTLPQDNFASATVYAITPAPPSQYNLSHSHTASRDTVLASEEYSYTLVVANFGPTTARNFTLSDTIASLLTSKFLQRQPNARTQVLQDSVFVWQFDSLLAGAKDSIVFEVHVPASLPFTPYRLFSRSEVVAVGDTLPQDNFASVTVYAISPLPPARYDLSLTKTTSNDTVMIGDEYIYVLTLVNLGPDTARDVILWDVMPKLLAASDFTFQPDAGLSTADTLFWKFDALAPNSPIIISFKSTVANPIPVSPFELINTSGVRAPDDIAPDNNFASAKVIAIGGSDCYLDRNVFAANNEPAFGINFGLSASSIVRLNIYDLTGTHIIKLAEQWYDAGQHRFEWNGLAKDGSKTGSGLYAVTIETGIFRCFLKFIIVR